MSLLRITSIPVCRFLLNLRQLDHGDDLPSHASSSDVLQFAAQPANTLPSFIASFAQPVHSSSFEGNNDGELETAEHDRAPNCLLDTDVIEERREVVGRSLRSMSL